MIMSNQVFSMLLVTVRICRFGICQTELFTWDNNLVAVLSKEHQQTSVHIHVSQFSGSRYTQQVKNWVHHHCSAFSNLNCIFVHAYH